MSQVFCGTRKNLFHDVHQAETSPNINPWISIASVCLSIKLTSFPTSDKRKSYRKDFSECEKSPHQVETTATEKKEFCNSSKKNPPNEQWKIYFGLADATTSNEQTTKNSHKFCLFHRWERRVEEREGKSHLDFSDLIMEIESIIFYTCYWFLNIVSHWSRSGFPQPKRMRLKSQ